MSYLSIFYAFKDLKTESVLWQIWRIKSGMEDHQTAAESLREELKVVHGQEETLDSEMQAAKKEVIDEL